MTETREEFRDRIRSIMISAALASDFPDNTGGQLADAAEAVVAQVLRDLRSIVTTDTPEGFIDPIERVLWSDIERFAAERGIDL